MIRIDIGTLNKIVGDKRRNELIRAAADRLILEQGLTDAHAMNLARQAWQAGDPATIVAVGQVWEAVLGRDEESLLVRGEEGQVVIVDVDREEGMVAVGPDGGLSLNYVHYLPARFTLVDWPTVEHPHVAAYREKTTAAAAGRVFEEPGETEEEPAPTGEVYVLVHRADDVTLTHLPMVLTPGYITRYERAKTIPFVHLDCVFYLREHLADFRAGWGQWRDLHRPGGRVMDGPEPVGFDPDPDWLDEDVADYLGWWLNERIRSDAVAEHGGVRGDYEVFFQFDYEVAEVVVAAVSGGDPTKPLPVDHRFAQCDGQVALFGPPAVRG